MFLKTTQSVLATNLLCFMYLIRMIFRLQKHFEQNRLRYYASYVIWIEYKLKKRT